MCPKVLIHHIEIDEYSILRYTWHTSNQNGRVEKSNKKYQERSSICSLENLSNREFLKKYTSQKIGCINIVDSK